MRSSVVPDPESNVPDAQRRPAERVPPPVQLIQMGVAIWQARAVYAAAELGIADVLAEGPRSVNELAASTGTHPPSLFRLLRAMASCDLVQETQTGQFVTTALGDAVREGAPGSA